MINKNDCTCISELFTDCVHVITPLMKSLLIQIFVTCDFTVETADLIWEINKWTQGKQTNGYKENSTLLNNCRETDTCIQNAI